MQGNVIELKNSIEHVTDVKNITQKDLLYGDIDGYGLSKLGHNRSFFDYSLVSNNMEVNKVLKNFIHIGKENSFTI